MFRHRGLCHDQKLKFYRSPPLFSTEQNNEEIVDLTKEESEKIRVEDCEAFQCQMVSFGRQAYALLASSQN